MAGSLGSYLPFYIGYIIYCALNGYGVSNYDKMEEIGANVQKRN